MSLLAQLQSAMSRSFARILLSSLNFRCTRAWPWLLLRAKNEPLVSFFLKITLSCLDKSGHLSSSRSYICYQERAFKELSIQTKGICNTISHTYSVISLGFLGTMWEHGGYKYSWESVLDPSSVLLSMTYLRKPQLPYDRSYPSLKVAAWIKSLCAEPNLSAQCLLLLLSLVQ